MTFDPEIERLVREIQEARLKRARKEQPPRTDQPKLPQTHDTRTSSEFL